MLDIDALLQPISDDAPSGEDLSFSSEFDVIQEARRSDDPSLDQGEWVTELKTADWNSVSRRCEKLLRENTKDLRLAVWLAEARTQLEGFVGLADGYRLVARLCESYWETVHPEAEDGDQELRIGNLAWLLNQSIQWARNIPLLDGPRGRYGATARRRWRQRCGRPHRKATTPDLGRPRSRLRAGRRRSNSSAGSPSRRRRRCRP